MNIHDKIAPAVKALAAAGFTVYVPARVSEHDKRPAGHVYVTREGQPGMAIVQIPSFPSFEPVVVSAPVKPSREYGSSVLVDHDDTIESIVAAVADTVSRDKILTRFVDSPRLVPADVRIPAHATILGE